ncbi:hypothetical protein [Segetibacter aerophilus]|uniref:Uncharacterized protein n=1 Tax=Segetibacter aerophilus TaxID=670293 RepID=A0A512BHB1_9BACT|nr:hypothetical protein [Segetibacter aerophilus]GEO11352.1 hypothetical protein SAE01_38480 [Segetibacter aerophilus]
MANPSPVSDVYKIIRGQVEHVDNNLGQRVIWLVIAQSFFFGAYASLINGKPAKPELDLIHGALIKILPIAALLTVLFTFIDVISSIVYMYGLRKKYEASLNTDVDVDSAYPNITGSKAQRFFMHASPILIPLLFITVWIILLYVQYKSPAAMPAPTPMPK